MRPLTPKAMEIRTKPLDIYIANKSDNEKSEEDYNLDDETKGNH
jgi:hypothetical protein